MSEPAKNSILLPLREENFAGGKTSFIFALDREKVEYMLKQIGITHIIKREKYIKNRTFYFKMGCLETRLFLNV
jgi:hypothetical protein